jgi:phage-related tail fiber protein
MLYIDPQNSSQIIAEQVIPETEGGWWIREVGLFDETGALIAVGNCPESYKPQLAEGSGRTQTVRMVLITSSTDNITLKIDPAVVLATRKYVDDKVLELKVYVDDLMANILPQLIRIRSMRQKPARRLPARQKRRLHRQEQYHTDCQHGVCAGGGHGAK